MKTFFITSFFVAQSFFLFAQSFTCTSSDSINNSLVFCLPFNANANDESGNGYDGTVTGATLIADRFGHANNAYNFNGTNNYIDLAKLLPDQTSLSISVWIKPTGNTTTNGLILFDGNSQCGNDLNLIYTNNTIKIVATKSGATLDGLNHSAQASLPSSSFNNWYHIVWTMSPTQSMIYINGTLSNTINSSGSNVGYHFTPTIGCVNDGGGSPCGSPRAQFFQGGIDDIRIYSRLLSQTEVTRLYNFTYAGISSLNNNADPTNIYPNPSKGILTVSLKDNNACKLDIFDMTGRNVKHFEYSFVKTFDISDLENGIYTIYISQGEDKIARKIILTK